MKINFEAKKKKPARLASSTRAKGFAIVRRDHQMEAIEDYLEAILDLFTNHGEVRVSELANYFGVAMATVNQHVKRLERLAYITAKPYRSIFLTEKGKKIALHARQRHNLVIEFLTKIGVPQETAQLDAEGIEHHVSEKTLKCLEKFIKSNL